MTTSKEIERLAEEHAIAKAKPMIRSMWPSESRSVMALHFSRSFEAGANAVLSDLRDVIVLLNYARECTYDWDCGCVKENESSVIESHICFKCRIEKALAKLEKYK